MGIISQVKIMDFVMKVISGEIRKFSDKIRYEKPEYIPHEIKFPIIRSEAESEGVSSKLLHDFFLDLSNKRGVNPQSCIVMRHGKVIAEGYWEPFGGEYAHTTYSMCKSITALAIACLIDEGKLSFDTYLMDIFTEYDGPFTLPRKKAITVEHLLTMSSGIAFSEIGSFIEEDWLKVSLTEIQKFAPGEKFEYNSINSYILSAIVKRISGQGLLEYLNSHIFEPMGIENLTWELCPKGIEKGGWGLSIRLEDMAKLGQLYLERGLYNSRRLISEEYFDRALKTHRRTDEHTGYGYHIWTLEDMEGYSFNGLFGQYVVILPKQDMVVAILAASENLFTDGGSMHLIKRYFVDGASLSEGAIKRSRQLQMSLHKLLSSLKYRDLSLNVQKLPWYRSFSGVSAETIKFLAPYFGREYVCSGTGGLLPFVIQLSHSNYEAALKKIYFERHRDGILLRLNDETATYDVVMGIEEPKKNILTFRGETHTVYAQVRLKYNEDDVAVLVCDFHFAETPHTRIIKCFLEDYDRIRIHFLELPAVWPALEKFNFTQNLPIAVQYKLKQILEPDAICTPEVEK